MNKSYLGSAVLSGSLMLFLGACGSIQTRSQDAEALAQVHKVAVVAFSVLEPAPAQIGLNLGSGKVEGQQGGTIIPASDATIDDMLQKLSAQFKAKMKWQVISPGELVKKPGYKKAYEATMVGWHNKMPPGQGQTKMIVKNFMDFDSVRILDVEGRNQLIKDLGVDAIVAAQVNVHLNGTTVMGIGARHVESDVMFMMYADGKEKPVWFEGQIKGPESDESVGKTNFFDEDLMRKLAVSSAQSAYEKIGSSSVE